MTHGKRLVGLRAAVAAAGLDGFIVPMADEHGSEYVGGYAQRLMWLTGFTGSAGTAVVLAETAAFLTDGRYTLQAEAELGADWTRVNSVDTPLAQWLGANVPEGARMGFDPWVATERQATAWARALEGKGRALVPVAANPLDALWTDRPVRSDAQLSVQPDALTGRTSAEKRGEVAAWLEREGADAAVVATLDGVAWLMNVRGADVARTPVPLAFALVYRDGTADLFVDPGKLTPEVMQHLGNSVRTAPYGAFAGAVGQMAGLTVTIDPERVAHGAVLALRAGGARVLERRDPTLLPKATKTAAEIAGTRAAHKRDGAALTRFLQWVAQGRATDELTATARLEAFRREGGHLADLSFETIMGSGPNGAIMHYRGTEATNRAIASGELLLIDSGGQYRDGTTDVTRTVAIGEPSAEMRDRFTRVLRGHIAVASAVFPKGTKGSQLDGLARRALWDIGTDYAHGTGHGVGSYLAVHEGPARIAARDGGDEPLLPGMILSNEPGYYKPGHYGIRIENLVLVVEVELRHAELPMLGFDNLTLAPIDRALIVPAMLTENERDWLNSYHALVAREIAPLVDGGTAEWLAKATLPI